MSEPSHVGDVVLPLDTEDATEASQMERVQAVFLSRVGGPMGTHAWLMSILGFSVRYLLSQAVLVNLDVVPVALLILRKISESSLEFIEMVEPR